MKTDEAMVALCDEVDFNNLARRIEALPDMLKPGDYAKAMGAIEQLRELPFPPGYLDELRTDITKTLQRGRRVVTYVYLSFYGLGSLATHMKVGIAKNVRNRLGGIKTGNPLPNLWAYSAQFHSRGEAEEVEAALLRHLSRDKAHGEWVNVHGLSERAAAAVVESLAEVASSCRGAAVTFDPHGTR